MRTTIAAALALLALSPALTAQDRELKLTWLGSAGGALHGEAAGNWAGRSLARAGDLNDDGIDDFVVSAWKDGFFDPAGRTYLIFGDGPGLPADTSLALADVLLLGAQVGDAAGQSLAAAGDVNGDGIDDLLIGAPRHDVPGRTDAGRVYLVYGSATLPATLNLGSMTALQGVAFEGATTGNLTGLSVASPGDLNGDGLAELAFGAQGASPLGRSLAGQVHVINGSAAFASSVDLATAPGTLILGGAAGDWLGTTLARAGDVNGDGIGDLLMGAPRSDPGGKTNAGTAYLLHGSASLPASIDAASFGSAGTAFRGASGGHFIGDSVAGGGDVDDDGFDDVLLGADQADPAAGSNAGQTFLVYGGPALGNVFDLGGLGAGGVVFNGANAEDCSGISVSVDGDVNGDGFDDILIGAMNGDASGNASGQAYLIYGGPALPSTLTLNLLGDRGVQISGEAAGDRCGGAVAFVGDVDADGMEDMLLGSRLSDAAGADSGTAHVVRGSCHMLLAEGSFAEGSTFTMKAFGPASKPFLLWLAPGALPLPLNTNKGPFWLNGAIEIGVLGFGPTGQLAFPVTVPTGLGLSGITGYWQFMAQPQGFHCDLSALLETPVP